MQIAVLIALWSVFTIIFEIPTGIIADRWNRRNMIIIAAVFQATGFAVWYFDGGFFLFAVGFLLWAIAGAMRDGAEEGLIYDNLKSEGREGDFTKVYGRAQFFANIGVITGIVSAGALSLVIPLEIIALISAGITLANIIFAFGLREKNLYREKNTEKPSKFFDTFTGALRFLRSSKIALIAMIFLIFFAGLSDYLDEFDALVVIDLGRGNLWVSAILTIRFGSAAIGDLLASKVENKIRSPYQLFLISGLSYMILIIFSLLWHEFFLLIFGLAFMVMAVSSVLFVNLLQQSIKEEGRATVMSIFSMGQNAAMIIFSLIFGALSGLFTLQNVYLIVAVYGLVGTLVFVVVAGKMTRKKLTK